ETRRYVSQPCSSKTPGNGCNRAAGAGGAASLQSLARPARTRSTPQRFRGAVMTEAEFQGLAAQGFNRVPLLAETFADLETPLSLYLRLANRSNAYLLESVVGGERFGRYSFIVLAAPVSLRAVGGMVMVLIGDGSESHVEASDPLVFVREFI